VMGGNLALVEKALGHWSAAEAGMRSVLRLAREARDWSSVFNQLNNLGNLAVLQRRFEEAHNCYDEAVRIAREHRLDSDLAFALINFAQLHLVSGDRARAREYVNLARAWPLEPPVAATALMIEARCFIDAGDRAAGAAAIHEALEVAIRAGDRANQMEALMTYALWLRRFNDEPAGDRLLGEIAASPLAHSELREEISNLDAVAIPTD